MNKAYPPMFGVAGAPFFEQREGLVLVGMIVRCGDVIDAITPLYRAMEPSGDLSAGLFRGAQVGGEGGVAQVLLMEGCAVTSLQYQAVQRSGQAALQALRLGFRRFSRGHFSGEERWSGGFSPEASPQITRHEEVLLLGDGFAGLYGNASGYVNRLALIPRSPQPGTPASIEGLTRTTLAELYQSNEQTARAARLAAAEEAKREAAREALHQDDLLHTTGRLRLWLHNGALSVEGATSFFLRGWDTGAYEERLRLLAPGSLLRLTFSCQAEARRLVLRLKHLSAELGGQVGYSPISITVNKKVAVKEASPPHDYYTVERFALSDYMKPGENTLELSLGAATSPYWLESLELLY